MSEEKSVERDIRAVRSYRGVYFDPETEEMKVDMYIPAKSRDEALEICKKRYPKCRVVDAYRVEYEFGLGIW